MANSHNPNGTFNINTTLAGVKEDLHNLHTPDPVPEQRLTDDSRTLAQDLAAQKKEIQDKLEERHPNTLSGTWDHYKGASFTVAGMPHHQQPKSWADVRRERAVAATSKFYQDSREREALRNRCESIINSYERMESDKDIALIALEALAAGAKL